MHSFASHRTGALTGAAILILASPAWSGPPMASDDPGILDPGQWEFIVGAAGASSESGEVYELPVLDISYGISENLQVSAAYPHVVVDPADASTDRDFGNLELGFKWRFYNGEKLRLSVAPAYLFGLSLSAALRGIGEDTDIIALPAQLEYDLPGEWRINGELGYAVIRDGTDEWGYGVFLSHPLGSRAEAMVELYGATSSEFDESVLNFTLGIDYAFTDALHLLGSVGSGLREPAGSEELDYEFFIGLQYFR